MISRTLKVAAVCLFLLAGYTMYWQVTNEVKGPLPLFFGLLAGLAWAFSWRDLWWE